MSCRHAAAVSARSQSHFRAADHMGTATTFVAAARCASRRRIGARAPQPRSMSRLRGELADRFSGDPVGEMGVEPITHSLKSCCSAIELLNRLRFSTLKRNTRWHTWRAAQLNSRLSVYGPRAPSAQPLAHEAPRANFQFTSAKSPKQNGPGGSRKNLRGRSVQHANAISAKVHTSLGG